MSEFLLGIGIGMIAMLLLVAQAMPGSVDGCRAAHPGYDCKVGWVVGEAFK